MAQQPSEQSQKLAALEAISGQSPKFNPVPADVGGVSFKDLKRVEAPYFYSAGVQILGAGNDFLVVFMQPRPFENPDGTMNTSASVADPVAVVAMTPHALKDFHLIVSDVLTAYEGVFGKINTLLSMRKDDESTKAK